MLPRYTSLKITICALLLSLTVGISCQPLSAKSAIQSDPMLAAFDQIKNFDMSKKAKASWYGNPFHGRLTANDERYNMFALTAAHKSLPFNSLVKVTNLINNESVVVRINDRGPYIHGREIDLSLAAAQKISMTEQGVALVKMEVLKPKKAMRI
jgi:rare lipoprotein A